MSNVVYKPMSEFWKDIFPEGMTSADIDKELADLEFVAGNIGKVYMHLTGGRASNPMIYAEVINALFDDHVTEVVEEHLKEQREEYEEKIRELEALVERLRSK